MHRVWQPYSPRLVTSAALITLIVLRLETIDADFKRLLRHLQLGDAAERMAEQVLAKTHPSQPLDGVDRQLKMLHYYLTDDGHDLGEVVRQRYRARGTKMPELHDHGAPRHAPARPRLHAP